MVEIIPFLVVAFLGVWGVVASVIQILAAQNSPSRKKAALSLIGSLVMILISIAAIYVRFYDILSSLTVALAAVVLLILNYIVFPKYLKFRLSDLSSGNRR